MTPIDVERASEEVHEAAEEYELSEEAKSGLARARQTLRAKYLPHGAVKKRILR